MQVFNRHVSAKGLTVFSLETALISCSMLVAARVHGPIRRRDVFWKIALATAVCALCFYYNDLYDLTVVHSKTELLVRVMRAAGTAALVLATVTALVPAINIGRGVFLTSVGLLLVVVPAWRIAFDGVTRDPHLEERVLIVGTGPIARLIAWQIQTQHDFAYRNRRVSGGEQRRASGYPDDVRGGLAAARQRGRRRAARGPAPDQPRGRRHLRPPRPSPDSGTPQREAVRRPHRGRRPTTYERITGKILTDGCRPAGSSSPTGSARAGRPALRNASSTSSWRRSASCSRRR